MQFLHIDDTVAVAVLPAVFGSMVRGFLISQVVVGSGGNEPYTYAISSGALPAGLTLSGDTIAGVPNEAGVYDFTVRATDNIGRVGTRRYQGTVATPVIVITPATLPTLTMGTASSTDFDASGGSGAYTWALDSGVLPAGLALNTSTGVVSGTPTTPGPYVFTLRVTDAYGNTTTQAFSGQVLDPYPVGYTFSLHAYLFMPGYAPAYPDGALYGTIVQAGSGGTHETYTMNAITQEDGAGRVSFASGMGADIYAMLSGGLPITVPGTPTGTRRWRLNTDMVYKPGPGSPGDDVTITRVA